MPARNPYSVLGVPPDASTDAIKAAWRRLAREHHPDVTTGEGDQEIERRATRRMAEINAAYHELRDPERRSFHRAAAARDGRMNGVPQSDWADGTPPGYETSGPPRRSGVPHARPVRPVTAHIDTSALLRPRNAILEPLDRSLLPGLPPRPRRAPFREPPRASTPSGPTHTRPGPNLDGELPDLGRAMETALHFGKFQGMTLADVADLEPTYIDWIVRTIDRNPELVLAARVVLRDLERSGPRRRRSRESVLPPR